jgi:hypothetical protein
VANDELRICAEILKVAWIVAPAAVDLVQDRANLKSS